MTDPDILALLKDERFCNYCLGTNSEDVRLWEEWLREHPEDKEQIEAQKKLVLLLAREAAIAETDRQYQRLKRRMGETKRIPVRGLSPALWRWPAAAAFLLATGIAIYMYSHHHEAPAVAQDNENTILPASYTAALLLSNGVKINLKDAVHGLLATEPGALVAKDAEGKLVYSAGGDKHSSIPAFNTLTTPKGGHFNVHLPDGTLVHLNAASSLKYLTEMGTSGDRVVELEGEAFFDVKHDAKHPFVVKAAGQVIRDIGTSFNVRSYVEEGASKTTLISGAVSIGAGMATSQRTATVDLTPGQQAYLTKKGVLKVEAVDTAVVVAWKNGSFYFRNADIGSVMRELSRWYDVEINYGKDISTDGLNGKISRRSNLSQILEKLSATGFVHFRTEGRKILVLK